MKIFIYDNDPITESATPQQPSIILQVQEGIQGPTGPQGPVGGAATISAGGVSAQISSLVWSNANNVSWLLSTNSTGQTISASLGAGFAPGSLVVGANTVELGQIVLSNSPTVTWGINGSTVTASAAGGGGGGGGFNSVIAGTQTATNIASFANSNGLTFGMSNSSVITASHNALTSQSNQALSGSNGSFAFQTATFGNSNNISFYSTNGSMVASYSQSVQPNALSAGTANQTIGGYSLADGNGISFGLNASTITASHNALTSQSNQALSGSNGSFAFQTATFGNSNNISFYSTNGSMVASYSQSAQTQANIAGISAGTTSAATGTVVMSNSNRMTFGMNGNTITGSFYPSVSAISGISLDNVQVGQALIHNGVDFVNQNVGNAGAGGGVNFFFDNTDSDITGYKSIPKTPSAAVEVDRTVVVNNNTVLLDEYASDSAGLGGTQIDAGVWSMDVYAYADITTATSKLTFDFYKRTAGGTETLLFTMDTGDIDFTAVAARTISSVQQAFAINATDRLVIKVSGTTTHTADVTLHFVYQGTTHYSVVRTPLVVRHNQLAGVQGGQADEYYHLNQAEYAGRLQKIAAISASGGSFSSGTASFANSNGMTFGVNGNTITASYAGNTIGASSGNIVGTLGYLSGTNLSLALVAGNNITFSQSLGGSSATITISAFNQTVQTQSNIAGVIAGTQTAGTGTLSFADSNGIAFGLSGSTRITASYTVPTLTAESNTFGISNLGNTAGTSGVVSANQVRVLFAGGNNVTLSQSTNGASATITISAFNQSTQTQNFAAANFSGGNTVGNTFLATSGTVAFYANNNVSFSLDSAAQKVSINAANQTVQTQNIITAISAGTQNATSGGLSFADSNGIAFGMSGSSRITASYTVPTQTNQTVGLYAIGNTTQNSSTTLDARTISFNGLGAATMGFSNGSVQVSVPAQTNQSVGFYAVSNTVQSSSGTMDARTISIQGAGIASVGVSNGSIIISVPAGGGGLTAINLSAGTTSNNLSAFVLSNSNNIDFGLNGSTITASNRGNTVSYWDNMYGGAGATATGANGSFAFTGSHRSLMVFQLDPGGAFPANITANTMNFNVSLSGSTATMSAAFTSHFYIGVYTRNGSSLSLLNSVSTSYGFGAAATNNSTGYQGQRFWTIHSSAWSSQPVFREGSRYFMAYFWSSAGALNQTGNLLGFHMYSTAQRQGTIGVNATASGTSQGWAPFYGVYTATTNAMPTSIGSNQLLHTAQNQLQYIWNHLLLLSNSDHNQNQFLQPSVVLRR